MQHLVDEIQRSPNVTIIMLLHYSNHFVITYSCRRKHVIDAEKAAASYRLWLNLSYVRPRPTRYMLLAIRFYCLMLTAQKQLCSERTHS